MIFRIVAGLRLEPIDLEELRDPTGSPIVIYERTISLRISRGLSSVTVSHLCDPYEAFIASQPENGIAQSNTEPELDREIRSWNRPNQRSGKLLGSGPFG